MTDLTMTQSDSRLAALLDQLRNVLKDERKALLSGQPIEIDAATQRKLLLAEEIERETDGRSSQADIGLLKTLARYNRDNSVICTAMLRHMTAALDRLRQHDPHRSYRSDGSEQSPQNHRLVGAA
jgi:flagellar biosynthesis/type III secretory pathway chaperone